MTSCAPFDVTKAYGGQRGGGGQNEQLEVEIEARGVEKGERRAGRLDELEQRKGARGIVRVNTALWVEKSG